MNFQELLNGIDYDFLRNNPMLKDRILFLTVSGSYAYGTNVLESDIDIRGVFLERFTDTLGLTEFEQYVDEKTDTVIYSLKKFLKLVRECNPNIIEMLYSNPEHYLYVSPLGKLILENRDIFLTKRAAYSFGGYANGQLNRLENALARDTLSEHEKLNHINLSVENAARGFETKFKLDNEAIKTYIGSWQPGEGEQILIDIHLNHYPLSRLKSFVDEMNNVTRSYKEGIGNRNKKKDDFHINKHMMHLIRLYFMCNEILEFGTAHTYREKEHDLLMDIRNGKYRNDDGTLKEDFNVLLNSLKNDYNRLKVETKLPDNVDQEKFNELVLKLYKGAI